MRQLRRRIFLVSVPVIAFTLALGLIISNVRSRANSPAPTEVSSPSTAQSAGHDIGGLYFAMAGMDISARRAVYATLPGSVRQKLWLLQLTLGMLSINELSPNQAAVFQRAGLLIRRIKFEGAPLQRDDAISAEIQALSDEANRVFGKTRAAVLFGDLGGMVSLRPDVPSRWEKVRYDGTNCSCSDLWSSYCGSNRHCEKDKDQCTHIPPWPACGYLWAYECNGLCVDDQEQ